MISLEQNGWFWFVLVAVVLLQVLDFVSTRLNLGALTPALPEQMADTYDTGKYAQSQAYTRTHAKFGQWENLLSLGVFLGFWWLGGFGWLDGIIRSRGLGEIWTGLIYLSILFLANHLISLPLSIYETFVIEERFGFNQTSPGTFVADQLKGLLLGAIIGLPLLALVMWIFQALPMAWLWGWISVTVITLALTYVAPTWIMPLFNKFEPLPDGELKTAIHAMAEDCEFPLKEVMVMDGSKRSSKSNAFFTGFGKNKRIALFDTLVQRHTTEELVAVLAHEIGHYKRRHIMKGMVLAILGNGVLFFLLGLVMENRGVFNAFGVEKTSIYLSLIFFGILIQPLNQVMSVAGNVFSRAWEFEADAYAAEVTENPGSLIDALKKLSRDNLGNLTPHPFYVFMNYSHPPVLQRMEALEQKG